MTRLLLSALCAAALCGCVPSSGSSVQPTVTATIADAKVVCAYQATGEVILAAVDPNALKSATAAQVQAIVAKACAAINAVPAPASTPVTPVQHS